MSTIAYHGRVVDLVHISRASLKLEPVSKGTLVSLSVDEFSVHLDGDESLHLLPQALQNESLTRFRDMQDRHGRPGRVCRRSPQVDDISMLCLTWKGKK